MVAMRSLLPDRKHSALARQARPHWCRARRAEAKAPRLGPGGTTSRPTICASDDTPSGKRERDRLTARPRLAQPRRWRQSIVRAPQAYHEKRVVHWEID